MYMNSLLCATVVFHIHFLFRASYMYACKSRFSVFSYHIFIQSNFAVRPAGACQAACLKASYTFAILQEYRVQIAVSKKLVHIPGRIINIRRTISGSALVRIHILPGLEGNIGVNQPVMQRIKYREIN